MDNATPLTQITGQIECPAKKWYKNEILIINLNDVRMVMKNAFNITIYFYNHEPVYIAHEKLEQAKEEYERLIEQLLNIQ